MTSSRPRQRGNISLFVDPVYHDLLDMCDRKLAKEGYTLKQCSVIVEKLQLHEEKTTATDKIPITTDKFPITVSGDGNSGQAMKHILPTVKMCSSAKGPALAKVNAPQPRSRKVVKQKPRVGTIDLKKLRKTLSNQNPSLKYRPKASSSINSIASSPTKMSFIARSPTKMYAISRSPAKMSVISRSPIKTAVISRSPPKISGKLDQSPKRKTVGQVKTLRQIRPKPRQPKPNQPKPSPPQKVPPFVSQLTDSSSDDNGDNDCGNSPQSASPQKRPATHHTVYSAINKVKPSTGNQSMPSSRFDATSQNAAEGTHPNVGATHPNVEATHPNVEATHPSATDVVVKEELVFDNIVDGQRCSGVKQISSSESLLATVKTEPPEFEIDSSLATIKIEPPELSGPANEPEPFHSVQHSRSSIEQTNPPAGRVSPIPAHNKTDKEVSDRVETLQTTLQTLQTTLQTAAEGEKLFRGKKLSSRSNTIGSQGRVSSHSSKSSCQGKKLSSHSSKTGSQGKKLSSHSSKTGSQGKVSSLSSKTGSQGKVSSHSCKTGSQGKKMASLSSKTGSCMPNKAGASQSCSSVASAESVEASELGLLNMLFESGEFRTEAVCTESVSTESVTEPMTEPQVPSPDGSIAGKTQVPHQTTSASGPPSASGPHRAEKPLKSIDELVKETYQKILPKKVTHQAKTNKTDSKNPGKAVAGSGVPGPHCAEKPLKSIDEIVKEAYQRFLPKKVAHQAKTNKTDSKNPGKAVAGSGVPYDELASGNTRETTFENVTRAVEGDSQDVYDEESIVELYHFSDFGAYIPVVHRAETALLYASDVTIKLKLAIPQKDLHAPSAFEVQRIKQLRKYLANDQKLYLVEWDRVKEMLEERANELGLKSTESNLQGCQNKPKANSGLGGWVDRFLTRGSTPAASPMSMAATTKSTNSMLLSAEPPDLKTSVPPQQPYYETSRAMVEASERWVVEPKSLRKPELPCESFSANDVTEANIEAVVAKYPRIAPKPSRTDLTESSGNQNDDEDQSGHLVTDSQSQAIVTDGVQSQAMRSDEVQPQTTVTDVVQSQAMHCDEVQPQTDVTDVVQSQPCGDYPLKARITDGVLSQAMRSDGIQPVSQGIHLLAPVDGVRTGGVLSLMNKIITELTEITDSVDPVAGSISAKDSSAGLVGKPASNTVQQDVGSDCTVPSHTSNSSTFGNSQQAAMQSTMDFPSDGVSHLALCDNQADSNNVNVIREVPLNQLIMPVPQKSIVIKSEPCSPAGLSLSEVIDLPISESTKPAMAPDSENVSPSGHAHRVKSPLAFSRLESPLESVNIPSPHQVPENSTLHKDLPPRENDKKRLPITQPIGSPKDLPTSQSGSGTTLIIEATSAESLDEILMSSTGIAVSASNRFASESVTKAANTPEFLPPVTSGDDNSTYISMEDPVEEANMEVMNVPLDPIRSSDSLLSLGTVLELDSNQPAHAGNDIKVFASPEDGQTTQLAVESKHVLKNLIEAGSTNSSPKAIQSKSVSEVTNCHVTGRVQSSFDSSGSNTFQGGKDATNPQMASAASASPIRISSPYLSAASGDSMSMSQTSMDSKRLLTDPMGPYSENTQSCSLVNSATALPCSKNTQCLSSCSQNPQYSTAASSASTNRIQMKSVPVGSNADSKPAGVLIPSAAIVLSTIQRNPETSWSVAAPINVTATTSRGSYSSLPVTIQSDLTPRNPVGTPISDDEQVTRAGSHPSTYPSRSISVDEDDDCYIVDDQRPGTESQPQNESGAATSQHPSYQSHKSTDISSTKGKVQYYQHQLFVSNASEQPQFRVPTYSSTSCGRMFNEGRGQGQLPRSTPGDIGQGQLPRSTPGDIGQGQLPRSTPGDIGQGQLPRSTPGHVSAFNPSQHFMVASAPSMLSHSNRITGSTNVSAPRAVQPTTPYSFPYSYSTPQYGVASNVHQYTQGPSAVFPSAKNTSYRGAIHPAAAAAADAAAAAAATAAAMPAHCQYAASTGVCYTTTQARPYYNTNMSRVAAGGQFSTKSSAPMQAVIPYRNTATSSQYRVQPSAAEFIRRYTQGIPVQAPSAQDRRTDRDRYRLNYPTYPVPPGSVFEELVRLNPHFTREELQSRLVLEQQALTDALERRTQLRSRCPDPSVRHY